MSDRVMQNPCTVQFKQYPVASLRLSLAAYSQHAVHSSPSFSHDLPFSERHSIIHRGPAPQSPTPAALDLSAASAHPAALAGDNQHLHSHVQPGHSWSCVLRHHQSGGSLSSCPAWEHCAGVWGPGRAAADTNGPQPACPVSHCES